MDIRPLIDFNKIKKKKFTKALEVEHEKITNNVTVTLQPQDDKESLQYITASEEEYKHLLDRIIDIIAEKNPEMLGNEKKFSLPVIQISKAGTRSVWTNFKDICDLINRQIDHVYNFFVKELGTEASLGGENQFFLKGKYNSNKIETLISKYVKEYVRCPNCKSFDTVLNKNNNTRLLMLECNFCNTKRSVAKS